MINKEYKQFELEYLKPFNWVQIKVILVSKHISSDSFKDKITYKLLTYKSYA